MCAPILPVVASIQPAVPAIQPRIAPVAPGIRAPRAEIAPQVAAVAAQVAPVLTQLVAGPHPRSPVISLAQVTPVPVQLPAVGPQLPAVVANFAPFLAPFGGLRAERGRQGEHYSEGQQPEVSASHTVLAKGSAVQTGTGTSR